MNADYSNRSDREGNRSFHTHRSDRYRFPEGESSYRFDDYGSSARGGYGNEGYSGTWGNQGNEMGGSRSNDLDRDLYGSYRTSRNYGSMGSYGGAQGYGDNRGGQHRQGSDYNYYSGTGARDDRGYEGHRSYGYQSDYDSHGSGYRYDSSPDLYGSEASRRFQGSDQGRYDFGRDNYNRGSSFQRSGRDRNKGNRGYSGYSSSEGNYMGSGYNRSTRGDYDTGNYGSMGSYDRGSSSMSYGEPYGESSYRSRQTEYPNDTYARDTENTRIQHRDSDYDYDPNHSFDMHKDPYYFTSHNRGRTWDRSRDSDRY